MQLHPHFLFNTLHDIATLSATDGVSAGKMIVKLSSLLRTALRHSGSDLIPLQQELRFVEEYLELEQMRFGSRLRVTYQIPPNTLQVQVPQLILQPLVENAIRHGVDCSRAGGWIEILSAKARGVLVLRVRNSTDANRPRGTGIGLRNTEARLSHLYAEEARLSFAVNEEERVATTTMSFPALGTHTDAQSMTDRTDEHEDALSSAGSANI
jgi:LytS/YehU family sensor histidine kinase